MKKLLLTIICLSLLVSCGGGKRYTIGMSQCNSDPWREKLNAELETSSFLYEDKIVVNISSADNDDSLQAAQINKFIDDKVDLLIVSPNQMETVSQAIDRAYEQDIPVILYDRHSTSNKYTSFIGANNIVAGKLIGRAIANKMGGKGKVAEIMGLKNSSPAIERHKGFMEVIKEYPDIEVVEVEYGNWKEATARNVMKTILKKHPDINSVYAHNDVMAHAAYEEALVQGKEKTISFFGIDGLPGDNGGVKMVKDGILEATCINPTRGDLVLKLAMDILKGKKYKKDNILTMTLVTDDNAEATLLQADELAMQGEQLRTLHAKVGEYLLQYSHQQIYLTLFFIITILLIVTLIVTYRTIMLKKQIAEKSAASKLSFFTNVSHELRTPLTLIADPVERLLEEDNLTLQQRSSLKLIRKNVELMLRLVGEILDLRKIDSGKMKLEPCKFDLSDALSTWLKSFEAMAQKRDMTLTLDVDDQILVIADINKVERIVYNLLSNAMKFTAKGGWVKLSAHHDGKDYVTISVEDNGIGISKEHIGHIFERFYQSGGNGTIGSGIGLSIVKSFAVLHGGYVNVESEEGKGTKFTVTLPIEVADAHNIQTISGAEVPREYIEEAEESAIAHNESKAKDLLTDLDKMGSETRPTVLVVDDNEDVLSYLSSLMGETYKVITAKNGKEGLDIATHRVPDLVVSDVMMPVMDGIELCRRLKGERATSHIPILLLTARSMEQHKLEGYEEGADGYLTKPFSGKLLLTRMDNILKNRKRMREAVIDGEYEMSNNNDADTKFINEFKKVVRDQMSNSDLSVETVSEQLGLSRVQLYRKVKAMTGSTPVEVIRISRLRKARQLLSSSHKTVSEISYEVGFSSPSYFTKCFKDYYGKIPKSMD